MLLIQQFHLLFLQINRGVRLNRNILGVFLFFTVFAHGAWSHETNAEAVDLSVLYVPGVVSADDQARKILKEIHDSGLKVKKVRLFWVSPDSHVNPQIEAMIRILHLGLQESLSDPQKIIKAYKYTPADFENKLNTVLKHEEEDFRYRMMFTKTAIEKVDELQRLSVLEEQKIHSLFHNVKTHIVHFLGVPNGIKFFTFYKAPLSRGEMVGNLITGLIRCGLQFTISNAYFRQDLGEAGFWTMISVSTFWTLLTSVYTEASLRQRTQGVSFNSKTGLMGVSRSWQFFASYFESFVIRETQSLAGRLGNFEFMRDFLGTARTSINSLFSKAIWEKKIRELKEKESREETKALKKGLVQARKPKHQHLSYFLNNGLNILNSAAAFLDQFKYVPGLRQGYLALGILGSAVEMFIYEQDRTRTAFRRLLRRFSKKEGYEPNANCEALLTIEFEEEKPEE